MQILWECFSRVFLWTPILISSKRSIFLTSCRGLNFDNIYTIICIFTLWFCWSLIFFFFFFDDELFDTDIMCFALPRSRGLRTQKLKTHLMRTQSLKVLLFKPGVDQYIAMHATLTAGDFFLAYFYPSSPFTLHFFQNLSQFFPVLACRINRSPCWMQVPVLSTRGI